MAEKNGNGRTLTVVVAIITLLVGLALGSMRSQVSASEKFVNRQQYERDRDEINRKLDQLLQFHLEGGRADR